MRSARSIASARDEAIDLLALQRHQLLACSAPQANFQHTDLISLHGVSRITCTTVPVLDIERDDGSAVSRHICSNSVRNAASTYAHSIVYVCTLYVRLAMRQCGYLVPEDCRVCLQDAEHRMHGHKQHAALTAAASSQTKE